MVKTHMAACGVIKTTPNNHQSHVGYDTKPHVHDTRPVDLENLHWNSTGDLLPRTVTIPLLLLHDFLKSPDANMIEI